MSHKSFKSLLENDGVRFAPGHFAVFTGRELPGIIDEDGKVFYPNSYDLPKDPHRVLVFALNFILAMIDTKHCLAIGEQGHFSTEEELLSYREKTREFLNNHRVFLMTKGESIESQDSGRLSPLELAEHLEHGGPF